MREVSRYPLLEKKERLHGDEGGEYAKESPLHERINRGRERHQQQLDSPSMI